MVFGRRRNPERDLPTVGETNGFFNIFYSENYWVLKRQHPWKEGLGNKGLICLVDRPLKR
ncbi:predicted protein [Histoplasma mississippiense (nom. inval.)]|uniref:predicted protein n=1 Tax=Ajellomyces capsulatus (strain NAm1 / WU24) TaxID=2059318 RepID=UPI000157CC6E|nr:predicted protein [Histoplasma mississippiense (nom. inval.)]EDN10318.1 predicted protein [Histoplasma mississippiense (nom. inval.)]